MSKDHAIQVFNHPQFGSINTVETENGKVLFKGNDVAKALGYSDAPQAVRIHCKGVVVLTTPSENQHGTAVMLPTKYITEADVYRLVMRSKLPEAERFQDWVCEEVLPSIRKHGAYLTDAALQRVVTEPPPLFTLHKEIFGPMISVIRISPILVSILCPSSMPSSTTSKRNPSLIGSSYPRLI